LPHAKNAKDAKGNNYNGERKETRQFLAIFALPVRVRAQAGLGGRKRTGKRKGLVPHAKDAKCAKGSNNRREEEERSGSHPPCQTGERTALLGFAQRVVVAPKRGTPSISPSPYLSVLTSPRLRVPLARILW